MKIKRKAAIMTLLLAIMFILLLIAAGLANYLYPLFLKPSTEFVEINKEASVSLQSASNVRNPEQLKPAMQEELAGSWKKDLPDIKESQLKVGVSDVKSKPPIISGEHPVNQLQAATQTREVAVGSIVDKVPETPPDRQVEHSLKAESKVPEKKAIAAGESPEVILPVNHDKRLIEKKQDVILTEQSKLLSAAASHYTLQLAALSAQKSLRQFVSQYSLPRENVYVYQTVRDKKTWYIVIFGEYESQQAASNASKHLPGKLANLNGWIRKYQRVHQDLQLNNE